jgi:hypothetical protein
MVTSRVRAWSQMRNPTGTDIGLSPLFLRRDRAWSGGGGQVSNSGAPEGPQNVTWITVRVQRVDDTATARWRNIVPDPLTRHMANGIAEHTNTSSVIAIRSFLGQYGPQSATRVQNLGLRHMSRPGRHKKHTEFEGPYATLEKWLKSGADSKSHIVSIQLTASFEPSAGAVAARTKVTPQRSVLD